MKRTWKFMLSFSKSRIRGLYRLWIFIEGFLLRIGYRFFAQPFSSPYFWRTKIYLLDLVIVNRLSVVFIKRNLFNNHVWLYKVTLFITILVACNLQLWLLGLYLDFNWIFFVGLVSYPFQIINIDQSFIENMVDFGLQINLISWGIRLWTRILFMKFVKTQKFVDSGFDLLFSDLKHFAFFI